ncbi:MAG: LysE family translocator, partial [Hyphomicrobiaceae bacterium]|nr:LysE family translocator [Hyphomicrobiaceae bacterium]
AAALGAGAAIAASPLLYQTVRIAGIAYLLWLAWETWSEAPGDGDGADAEQPVALSRAFRDGLITNLLNPKAAAFYIAVLPVFVDPGAPPVGQMLTLAAMYVAIATAVHLAIVMLASRARPLILAGGNSVMVRRGLALSLVAVAIWMAAATRR